MSPITPRFSHPGSPICQNAEECLGLWRLGPVRRWLDPHAASRMARDATLLALGAECVLVDEMLLAADALNVATNREREDLTHDWPATNAAAIRAHTAAGHASNARILAAVARVTNPSPGPFQDLALSLVRDLAQ
jgi:hypothetical protein